VSIELREKLETLIRSKVGYTKATITPGEFLATTIKGKSSSYITYWFSKNDLKPTKNQSADRQA